jgi:hypothetical protein
MDDKGWERGEDGQWEGWDRDGDDDRHTSCTSIAYLRVEGEISLPTSSQYPEPRAISVSIVLASLAMWAQSNEATEGVWSTFTKNGVVVAFKALG